MHTALALLAFALAVLLPWLPAPAAEGAEGSALKPFNVPVNTPADEDEPHVADGGLTLYYTSNAKGKEDLLFARRRTAKLSWPSRGEIVEDYVSTPADDRSVFATGGKFPHFLFFATKKDRTQKNFDLYVAVRQGEGKAWSAPTPVMKVNTDADELHPWLTNDGKALYFSRKTAEGWRLFVTARPDNVGPGGWGEPEMVELPVGFHHATVTPDGKTMYLQGPVEKDRWGLFAAARNGKVTGKDWSKPEPVEGLAHPKAPTGDRSPNLTRDGQFLYYASDRPDGKGGLDLWGIRTAMLAKKK